ncbi:MAG: hypothetical protein MJ179_02710 [Treponema sp.]|nr:hypothetical protein [Treponema sp.]
MTKAKFSFSNISENVKSFTGYVLGEVYDVVEVGGEVVEYTFKPVKVVMEKLITKGAPDFKRLEQMAIENCLM